MHRRTFIRGSLVTAAALPLAGVPARSDDDAPPPLDDELVGRFVGRSHFDLDAVRGMLADEPALVNATWDWGDGDWETGLGAASHTGRREIAELLLERGARIDVFAATMLGQTAIVRAFLDAYPAIHGVPGPHGIPLLSHAVFGRGPARATFELLLERGAAVNSASVRGMTPLMAAASVGDVDVVDALLARGADPSPADFKSLTALDRAVERGHDAAAARLRAAAAAGAE